MYNKENTFDKKNNNKKVFKSRIPLCPISLQTHTATYEDVEKHGKYDLLRSTRHFGGMAWYLVNKRRADRLIVDMLERDL